MLSEEGLVLLGVFAACALVALGVLELMWPTRPRHPERPDRLAPELWRQVAARTVLAQRRAASAAEPALGAPVIGRGGAPSSPPVLVDAPAAPAAAPAPATPMPPVLEPAAPAAAIVAPPASEMVTPVAAATVPEIVEPVAAATVPEIVEPVAAATVLPVPEIVEPTLVAPAFAEAHDAAPPTSPPTLRIVPPQHGERPDSRRERPRGGRLRASARPAARASAPEAPAEPTATIVAPSPDASVASAEPPPREVSIVERCRALLEAERFPEVVTLGEETLKARKASTVSVPGAAAAQETAQLWGVVGLAKQGLEDFEAARFAFEEAIAVAPRAERLTWERRLAALALTVGRQSLVGAEVDPTRPARVDSLRSAIDWLERGLVVAPDDTGLRDALAATREALWPAYEAVVKALVQRQELDEARRMLDDVLADPECPSERRDALRRLIDGARSAEAGQATADALRHLQRGRDDEAATALARAESLLAALSPEGLSASRRQELERRLWSAYLKLGTDRVEAGAREAAMSPLFRALALTELGSERQEVVRAMLVRALGDIVDERSAAVGRLIDAGDVSTATAESDKLWSLLRGAVDQGLPEDDVLDVFNKVLALFRRMSGKRA